MYMPTAEEEATLRAGGRSLWWMWKIGDLTYREAAYLLRRAEAMRAMLDRDVPWCVVKVVMWLYDFWYEEEAISEPE